MLSSVALTLKSLSFLLHEEQGANVTAHYRTSDATLLPLFATYGLTRIHLAQADLSSESAVISLFSSKSIERFGPVEVVVVNHGAYIDKHVLVKDMSLAQWEKTMSNNLTSSFLAVREYLKRLEKGISVSVGMGTRFGERAAITLVGSTAGKFGEARHTDYAASKSGGKPSSFITLTVRLSTDVSPRRIAMMYGFTMSLKNEIVKIAPRGRVNCVAPGWTKTPMAAAGMKDPTQVGMALA